MEHRRWAGLSGEEAGRTFRRAKRDYPDSRDTAGQSIQKKIGCFDSIRSLRIGQKQVTAWISDLDLNGQTGTPARRQERHACVCLRQDARSKVRWQ